MELDREGRLALDLIGGVWDVSGLGDGHAPFREAGDRVAVGHPHLGMDPDTVYERGIRTDDVQHRPAIFPGQGALDLAAAVVRDVLGAVTDAQDRQLAFHTVQVELRGVGVADGTRAAGQDDTLHGVIQRRHFIKRKDLAIHIQLPQAAADQLGHLGAEVEDQDLEPKSRIRILFTAGIVGRFLGDGDVVRMALGHAAGSDAGKFRALEGLQVLRTAVAHAGAETAHQLVHCLG